MEACLAAGRAVILVGDLNICPQPIDSCDPGDVGRFGDRADKKWLSAVMKHNGGYFVDLFRHFYPTRSDNHSGNCFCQWYVTLQPWHACVDVAETSRPYDSIDDNIFNQRLFLQTTNLADGPLLSGASVYVRMWQRRYLELKRPCSDSQ